MNTTCVTIPPILSRLRCPFEWPLLGYRASAGNTHGIDRVRPIENARMTGKREVILDEPAGRVSPAIQIGDSLLDALGECCYGLS
jgi:hypothetical protein